MALARTWSIALDGVTGRLVQVEADIALGLPGTTVIGMGDAALTQARERVRAAVLNSGLSWPDRRITLALSPAGLPKKGAGFDLALAVALLQAAGTVPQGDACGTVLIGELGLDGALRPVRGVLPLLLAARSAGIERAIVPAANLTEAGYAGLDVAGGERLTDVLAHFKGEPDRLQRHGSPAPPPPAAVSDMADVRGQAEARLALEVAAAGGHHMAMIGPPGAGKTMLATRLPGLLPALDFEQALEVTAVHSVAGLLDDQAPLITRPPFVDPHHNASVAAVIGGGSGWARPGCVSLAHHGVLHLDEAPEFARPVLDALRQPLESGVVTLARAAGAVRYPARFQLVISANPCPCAAAKDLDCRCASGVRRRYLGKLSGPLVDRVDIRLRLPPLEFAALTVGGAPSEPSAAIADRVRRARQLAAQRWRGTPWRLNGEVPGPTVRRSWRGTTADVLLLDRAVRTGHLTARGYDRVLRLALTCADLAGREVPTKADIGRALALRCGQEW